MFCLSLVFYGLKKNKIPSLQSIKMISRLLVTSKQIIILAEFSHRVRVDAELLAPNWRKLRYQLVSGMRVTASELFFLHVPKRSLEQASNKSKLHKVKSSFSKYYKIEILSSEYFVYYKAIHLPGKWAEWDQSGKAQMHFELLSARTPYP